ncbi:MAG: lipoate--protein ligase family protein [Bifidobacteriaceae bacterium]|jgi:lipoate-protein ligase A|nr:lipoate--protein ligase family protein [Bifidobacteriaceae bacterium]
MTAMSARGSFKQPGGKLVSATVRVSGENLIESVAFDGDFYAEYDDGSDATLEKAAASLVGLSVSTSFAELETVIASSLPENLTLVGVDARSMAFSVARATAELAGQLSLSAPMLKTQSRGKNQDQGHNQDQSQAMKFKRLASSARLDLTADLIAQRWSDLGLHLIDPAESAKNPLEPAVQMALDEVIARHTASGNLPPTLRFWEWAAPAVIIGLNQSLHNEVNTEAAQESGVRVVRRVTGGGAMFVEPGNTITYSLTTPLGFVKGLGAEDAYSLCEHWIFEGLSSIGIMASHEPINDISSPAGKIGGAAQRRYPAHAPVPGALLHHTTMAYDIDATKMLRILRVNKEKSADKAVKSAAKRVDPMKSQSGLSRREVIASLAASLHTTAPHLQRYSLPPAILEEARRLAASKFATEEWTARIA